MLLSKDSFEGMELALFRCGGDHFQRVCANWPLVAGCRGHRLIQSAFRMDDKVPVVIPEIKPEARRVAPGIIAIPNCTTAVALMAIGARHHRT